MVFIRSILHMDFFRLFIISLETRDRIVPPAIVLFRCVHMLICYSKVSCKYLVVLQSCCFSGYVVAPGTAGGATLQTEDARLWASSHVPL